MFLSLGRKRKSILLFYYHLLLNYLSLSIIQNINSTFLFVRLSRKEFCEYNHSSSSFYLWRDCSCASRLQFHWLPASAPLKVVRNRYRAHVTLTFLDANLITQMSPEHVDKRRVQGLKSSRISTRSINISKQTSFAVPLTCSGSLLSFAIGSIVVECFGDGDKKKTLLLLLLLLLLEV